MPVGATVPVAKERSRLGEMCFEFNRGRDDRSHKRFLIPVGATVPVAKI